MRGARLIAMIPALCTGALLAGCAPFPRRARPQPTAAWGLPMRQSPHSPETPPSPPSRSGPPSYCVRHRGCYHVIHDATGYHARGIASWYGVGADGKPTASGAPYRPEAMRVASRTLPFGTWVRIRNLDNGREAVAMVDDRGPFHRGRIIDASVAVARRLGFYRRGTAPVRVTVVTHSRLSRAQQAAARADEKHATRYARRHRHGSVPADAGRVTVHGVIDVTGQGLDLTVGVASGVLGAGFDVMRWLF